MTNDIFPLATDDNRERNVVLHSCCGPCTGEILTTLLAHDIRPTVFFYNPNIDLEQEYTMRKNEVVRFARKHQVEFVDGDYEVGRWQTCVTGLEDEPEGGRRCEVCFLFRLKETARFAQKNGFKVFTSTLGISRYKNFDLITQCGQKAGASYGLVYWDYPWRKKGGSERMYAIAKAENFYRQEYCGCLYSRVAADRYRVSQGLGPIEIGKAYYGVKKA